MIFNKTIQLIIKRIDGEICVQWIENGVYNEEKTYYTDSLKDARETRDAIIKNNKDIHTIFVWGK